MHGLLGPAWRKAAGKWPAVDRWLYSRSLTSYRLQGKEIVHLLHIGKTGGTAIKEALISHQDTPSYRIELHGHRFRLRDVPEGDRVIFFLRDPISRFRSAFYSRQRMGLPRYYFPWTKGERRAFAAFPTANDLALGLSSPDQVCRNEAIRAMQKIGHLRWSLMYWFESEEYFLSRLNAVMMVGFQRQLEKDFERLKDLLGLPGVVRLPTDDLSAHRAPARDLLLSGAAISNLRAWYSRDYAFIDLCRKKGLTEQTQQMTTI